MENEKISKDMEILLGTLLSKDEFETLKKIIASRGHFKIEEEE